MNDKNRKIFSINQFESRILRIVFISAIVPFLLITGFFYFMFYDLVHTYLKTGMATHFLKDFLIVAAIFLAYYFVLVGILAYRFVHKLLGAIPRILRELDERISGKSKAHIHLRKGDYASEIIDRINTLIDKLP
ncbi:MAG: hypothetical protein WC676_06865 [Candidatus Omnitrophota bacterium]